MGDKKKTDAMQVIEAMIGSISMEEAVNLITHIAHDRDIPIFACHMQSDSGEVKTPLDKTNFNNPDLQMRFTVFGFPKKVADRTVEMLIGQGVEMINYRVRETESATESLDNLNKSKGKKGDGGKGGAGPFQPGKPKGW